MKLDDKKRQSINERLALHEELRAHYKDRQYMGQQCHLCGWTSNELTLDKAIEANKKHEATHPETAQIAATEIGMDEIRDSLHDHECVRAKCACKCGCQEGPFCVLVFGPLCSVCTVREMRGDDEHGLR